MYMIKEEKNEIFTKEKSKLVYGVAICLMVFHHLFAFPERINSTYELVFDFSVLHVETILSYFGKICTCMFAFLSGYGMAKKRNEVSKGYKLSVIQIKKLYRCYWSVFVLFIPYGMCKGILKLQLKELIKNIIGCACSYNAEWWYIREYVIMLFIFPCVYKIIEYIHKEVQFKVRWLLEILALSLLSFIYSDMQYIILFIIGIVFVKEEIFEAAYKRINGNYWSAILVCLTILIRTLFGWKADAFITPIFVYAIYIFSEKNLISKYVIILLKNIGKYSTYIWLIHTFFIYYYFQNIIFAPKYSMLIFTWTMILCMCVGWGITKVLNIIDGKLYNIRK